MPLTVKEVSGGQRGRKKEGREEGRVDLPVFGPAATFFPLKSLGWTSAKAVFGAMPRHKFSRVASHCEGCYQ